MRDNSRWFIYKHEGNKVGCFRLKPLSNPECAKALELLNMQKNAFKMSDAKCAKEFVKIIAKHVIQDWEDVWLEFIDKAKEDTGKYTPENAYRLMIEGNMGHKLTSWIVEKSKSISV